MILPLVSQEAEAFDFIWLLIPILCCLLTLGQRGEKPQDSKIETESFYTTLDIKNSYEMLEKETDNWRQESLERNKEKQSPISMIKNILGGRGSPPERYVVKDKNPPRLLRLNDASGPIYFELTEVEGGGTVVKATYNISIKGKISKLKINLPLKIPAAPIGLNCPSCGKSVLKEFNLCPYCGSKLITE